MATKQQIIDYLLANPNLSDAELVSYMAQNQISPAQLAEASGAPVGQISAQIAATIPNGQTIQLGDTIVQPVYQVTGSGDSEQVGGIQNVITYKADENKTGGAYTQYTPTGEVERTGEQQKVKSGLKEFALGAGLLFGGGALLDAFGNLIAPSAGSATGAGLEFAGSGGAFDLANAGIAGGTAAFTPAQLALIEAGASAAEVAAAGAGSGLLTKAATDATAFELQNAGASALTDLSATNQAGLLTGGKTAAELAADRLAAEELAKKTAITTIGGKTAAELAAEALAKKTIADELAKKLGDTASGLFQTTGSLLQSKESKEAAQKAATDIGTATQAAVAGSQFRPVGMTSRFGTSQYTYDPKTGQMISAGYQLSPEAKAQQDRFATMANYSLTQAENAQSQFAPLQTGAQNLFGLGNQYISQSPQDVAQNYINQQMALLQPSREVELANLQNRLFQQGRTGVSVAQGGSMGATTPELQALYNARAQQEAVLAANAQQAGQQNVLFGAGLLGQGTNALNQYFGGQVAAYQPYQAAMGQVQNLESLGQQPLQMGASLGQQSSAAGARAGQLGIQGQQLSSAYNTGANATFNPYAGLLTAAGNPSSMFGQSVAKYLTGTASTPFDALSSTKYGDGLDGYQKMIADIYGT